MVVFNSLFTGSIGFEVEGLAPLGKMRETVKIVTPGRPLSDSVDEKASRVLRHLSGSPRVKHMGSRLLGYPGVLKLHGQA